MVACAPPSARAAHLPRSTEEATKLLVREAVLHLPRRAARLHVGDVPEVAAKKADRVLGERRKITFSEVLALDFPPQHRRVVPPPPAKKKR